MRKLIVLIAGLALVGALVTPAAANSWIGGGLGIGYAGPGYRYPAYAPPVFYPGPGYYPPAYYPPAYYPPAYYPPAYYYPPPGAYWPDYGPDVAVRWNRYFTPDHPEIRGYTLPR